MREKLSLYDLDLKNKKALIRVDFNVPLENGQIIDDTRIQESVPTIEYVLQQGGIPILMSHLGRPEGTADPQLSLAPCAQRLEKLIKRPVIMAPDCLGPSVEKMVQSLKPGDVLMLENLRFHKGEEKPEEEPTFASALAELGDVYIDDAFSAAHRPHASITSLAHLFPGKAAMGLLMRREISYLSKVLFEPKRPFVAILGGSKISTKFKIIQVLMKLADCLLIGGAMAYTFFKAENFPIGKSLVENDFLGVARQLMDVSMQSRCRLLLPTDAVITRPLNAHEEISVVQIKEGIPDGFQGVDIGPQTIQRYEEELKKAATVFWNGPLGVFERPPFNQGTDAIAGIVDRLSATTVVGGGDTIAAVKQGGGGKGMSHLSTGGGAILDYIGFGTLPGIEVLSDKNSPILLKNN